ncbi:MAG: hypothetical protein KDD74_02385 [Anaerolineales bacterium]|nr:hypothetical protein [Anaerolineales bacterium]
MRNQWIKISSGLMGSVAVFLMLFANPLGLESFPTWGIRRSAILVIGLALLAISLFYREDNFLGKFLNSPNGQLGIALLLVNTGIFLIYIWFVSAGLLKYFESETNYFDLQANAFAKGQLELDVTPDPALLAFTDESLYEPENRIGIPALWDATLYKGKYYLYWGPAPALLLAMVKPFYTPDIGDRLLVLIFLAGTLLFLNLIILALRKRFFAQIPNWAVVLAIAFAGLVNPMPYVLVEGRIYEAAIVAAQFFLMGGFYFLLLAFELPTQSRLALAGSFFVFAIGSRTTVLPAVALISLILLVWAFQTQRSRMVSLLLAFAIPIAIGGAAYGWYNYARFGSFTEFGYRYQLTSYNLYQKMDETFSVEYIPPNLYKTLVNPLEQRSAFPYIFPTRWAGPEFLSSYQPKMYLTFTENITGMFIGSPFVLLALLAFIKPRRDLRWITLSITAAFLAIFFTLQAFFFVAMRYMLDFIPTLTLLVIIGFWHGFDLFKHKKGYIAIALVLLAYTIALSLLIAFSGNLESFRILNLDLVQKMTWTVNSLFK